MRTTYFRVDPSSARGLDIGARRFDWDLELKAGHAVYALRAETEDVTQGLVSLSLVHEEKLCEVHLAESAPWNVGARGRYQGVGGHLFAIACRPSFEAGFGGIVAFIAKTALMEHYKNTLGAVQIGRTQRMVIETDAARRLVAEYLDD